jgi:hypothetical protein
MVRVCSRKAKAGGWAVMSSPRTQMGQKFTAGRKNVNECRDTRVDTQESRRTRGF